MKTKIKLAIIGALAFIGAVTSQAQTPSLTGTNGVIATVAGWVSSYNTNLAFADFIGWDGPVFQNNVNIGNELGASYDLWRSQKANNPNGLFFVAPEGRFRQAAVGGALSSENIGGEIGWQKYDFRAGLFGDAVHRENGLTAVTGDGRFGGEIGVFADKMFSVASGAGLFVSEQPDSRSHTPLFGLQLSLSFGNGSGFLGLFGKSATSQ